MRRPRCGRAWPGAFRAVLARCFVLLCCFGGRAARADNGGDAAQCVREVGRAVDAADAAAFERLVDVDAIVENALDNFLRQARQPEFAAQLPPMLAILLSQAAAREGVGESVRTLLFNEARAFVTNGVASGAFAGQKPTGAAARGLMAPLFADASTGRKEVRQIGQPRRQGKAWLVPFVVHDAGNGLDYDVLGRVSLEGGACRLAAVENMDELQGRIIEESRQTAP